MLFVRVRFVRVDGIGMSGERIFIFTVIAVVVSIDGFAFMIAFALSVKMSVRSEFEFGQTVVDFIFAVAVLAVVFVLGGNFGVAVLLFYIVRALVGCVRTALGVTACRNARRADSKY